MRVSGMPTGTVTFLLTDVEGSTAAWERDPEGTAQAIANLDRLVAEVIPAHSGVVVKQRGEGDSHFCVFTTATDATLAGVALSRRLVGGELAVRMSIHTGEADLRDGDYYGRTVNRAARLRAAGHGGQLLVSEVTAALIREALPGELNLVDLGVHRLRDLSSPESIFQVTHPDIPTVTRPLATLDMQRNNLPLQLTALIGREQDVTEVRRHLRDRRLVSLVALGGTGKTRLAQQVAAESSGEFAAGVWYAELAGLHRPEQVPAAILSAVGGPDGADDGLAEAVDWIASKSVLLVLDNCEHLIDAVAHCVTHLLTRCEGLKVLATSRQPLDVAGESVFRLQPLDLPTSEDELARIAASPAVQLFVERGRAVNPRFELMDENAATVAKLCAGLDGLPLAIELAASRLKILEPAQVLQRLGDRLSLVDSTRGSNANRTVRAAIEWSHDLLKPDESTLLRRMAIFEAPVTFGTIESVCGTRLDDVAVALAGLVDHSLVAADTGPGDRRYRLLDLVRAYASERLDATAERPDLESARLAHFDEIGQRLWQEEALSPSDRADLLCSQPDMESALEWCREHDPVRLPTCVLNIANLWRELGRWTLAAHWVNRALESTGTEPRVRLGLLLLQGGLSFDRWEFRDGIRFGSEGLALARELEDQVAEELAHNAIASSSWRSGDLDGAYRHNERALAIARARPGGEREASVAANNLGLVCLDRDDLAEAERWFQLAFEFSDKVGEGPHGLWRLGAVAERRNDIATARQFYESGLASAQAQGWPEGVALLASSLGRLLERQCEFDSAADHFRLTHQAASEAGKPSLSAQALLDAARVVAQQGHADESAAITTQAFLEMAGEPVRQIVVVDEAIDLARSRALLPLAYDLSMRLLDVTLRDGTAKGAAWATYLVARCALDVGRIDEARRLALQARVRFVALGDVDVGSASAAYRIEECDEVLARVEAEVTGSTLT